MTKRQRITRIMPLRSGLVCSILYGICGLIALVVNLIAFGEVLLAILSPFLYAIVGFIGGIVGAVLCNLIAQRIGGLEFEVDEAEVE